MANPSGVTIAGRFFRTKALAEEFIRELLGRYRNSQSLTAEDSKIALAILNEHPNRAAIIDCGILRICVQWLDSAGKQRRFLLVRKDSSIRDFTWRHIVHPRSQQERVTRVCRSLVRDQIERVKAQAFRDNIALTCPVSGLRITRDVCDVDHIRPATFDRLVEDWVTFNRLTIEDVEIVPSPHYQEPDTFEDEFLAENWRQFHKDHARLRVVHPTANRSILRKAVNVHA